MHNYIFHIFFISFTLIFSACGGSDSPSDTSTDQEVPQLAASTLSIAENTPAGASIGIITIIDVGSSAITSISLSGTGSENFSVSTNGLVSLSSTASLDFETSPLYSLTAIANNTAGSSSSVSLSISITDVADTAPTLENFSATIEENATVGTVLGSLSILNPGDSEIISYTLSDTLTFSINENAQISTKSSLDFELKSSYSLSVFATSTAGDSTSVSVNITVLDVIEEVLTPGVATLAASTANVAENATIGSSIGSINIIDTGSSPITSITLSGTGSENFSASSDGVIRLNTGASLDYETKTSYALSAYATNASGNSQIVSLNINITNIEDTVATLSSFSTNIDENISIGSSLGSISVLNVGDSAISSFTLSDSSVFNISSSGEITTKVVLDYETTSQYNLNVFATNAAGNSASVSVTISLNDIADTVATLSAFTASISESATIGTVVGTLNVLDAGDSEITSFTLINTSSFAISSTGEITTKTTLDYETTAVYNLSVYATSSAGNSSTQSVTINIIDVVDEAGLDIPTLVVIMNWNNYAENDPSIWSDKIFNKSVNSVNTWYSETMNSELQLVPVTENSGIQNDGIITINMGKNHPGGSNDTTFRDTEIYNAITNAEVVNNMNFASLDKNADGDLDRRELQIIFIVAGGEESYGDPQSYSIWAHAWSYPSDSAPSVDGVNVMRYTGLSTTSGGYARFGANHDTHKATIGIIVHEVGHSLLDLGDYYDNGGGSGLGWYDVMSGGGWSYQDSDSFAGETPTQVSAYNRIDANVDDNVLNVSSTQSVTLNCSSRDLVKLITTKTNEYFLLECRDTARVNSDIALNSADASFTTNKLFAMLYHVDTDKSNNYEDGLQTSTNHYKVALVEKSSVTLMTSTSSIRANNVDTYTLGDVIDTTKTRLYDSTSTGYSLEVTGEDYANRTMTINITK